MESLFFEKLIDLINKELNFDCREYNEAYIKRRLNARIIANSLKQNDYAAYYKVLQTNREELRKLFDALTINVTQFFRDVSLWHFLESNVLPEMINENKSLHKNTLNIWSCGCSSGEEPYTLAILLKEIIFKQNALAVIPKIIATDIDEISLNKAIAGVYDFSTLNNVPKKYFIKYFHQITNSKGNVQYKIDDSIKNIVQFKRHNFFLEPPPDVNFDMILCRNVIIYFTPESKDKLLSIFYDSLRYHGWLVIGKSEVLFTTKARYKFYLYDALERIYRKERRTTPNQVQDERRKNWWEGYSEK